MNTSPYLIPSHSVIYQEEIKKSVFITQLAYVSDAPKAKEFIEKIKQEHSSARHNCWAYVAGRPEDSMKWGFSDDGEPSGTAGKPMLAQLNGSKIGNIAAVVTRYSGGIKLGTGGLVRAYGGGVQQAISRIVTKEFITYRHIMITMNYALIQWVESVLERFEGYVVNTEYSENVAMEVAVSTEAIDEFEIVIVNTTSGKAKLARFG